MIRKILRPIGGFGLLAMVLVRYALLQVDQGVDRRNTGERLSRDLANSGSIGEYTIRSINALVLCTDDRWLPAVNPDSNSVSIVDLVDGKNVQDVAVGIDPRTVAISDGGSSA